MTDRNSNRCANTESLNRYEREIAKAEREFEQTCRDMYDELDEALEMIAEIAKRYELQDEAREYIKDLV